jgi:hypothetical protein
MWNLLARMRSPAEVRVIRPDSGHPPTGGTGPRGAWRRRITVRGRSSLFSFCFLLTSRRLRLPPAQEYRGGGPPGRRPCRTRDNDRGLRGGRRRTSCTAPFASASCGGRLVMHGTRIRRPPRSVHCTAIAERARHIRLRHQTQRDDIRSLANYLCRRLPRQDGRRRDAFKREATAVVHCHRSLPLGISRRTTKLNVDPAPDAGSGKLRTGIENNSE